MNNREEKLLAEKFSNSIEISNDVLIRIKTEVCQGLLTTKPAPESGAGFAQFTNKKNICPKRRINYLPIIGLL